MNTGWRFLDTGANTGEFNMRVDERLADEVLSGASMPTLRLFRWQPSAISLGYHQQVEDVDLEACRTRGIDVVKRPTGGRAILHADELTYSCILPLDGFESGSTGHVYKVISKALVRGLKLFGVDVDFQRSQPHLNNIYKSQLSIPCFTSSAKYEVEWRGRKLVGSAQRRFVKDGREVVLQHGSILTGPSHKTLAQLLRTTDSSTVASITNELSLRTVDLQEITGRDVDVNELGICIRKGFEQEWGIEFDLSERYSIIDELKYA